jgi:hypothetical protein
MAFSVRRDGGQLSPICGTGQVPIMSVVVPRLIIDGIKWKFMGEQTFKRSCLVRGLVPIRADPNKLHDHDPTETEMR